MNELILIGAAASGGILPALAWLWFWLREDSAHPEPGSLIALAFLAGMIAVAIVIPIEKLAAVYIVETTLMFIAWSFIEEITKYVIARFTVLNRKEDDEPIDPVIYMVVVALGFAAAENTLFLLSPLAGDTMLQTIMTGNLRFVGATLLHVLSSAVIGVALAFSFYRGAAVKRWFTICGVILASVLHATFNFFILNTPEGNLLRTLLYVWLGAVILIAVIEWVKRLRPRSV